MDTIILRTLQESDKYGLEMLNEIKSLSDELYSLKQPTLYSSLKRLEKQGYIISYPGSETKGANRTYYKLTEMGISMLESDQKQWEFSRTIIDKLLSNKEFDSTDVPPFDLSNFRPATKRERKDPEPKVIIKYIEVEKPSADSNIDNYPTEPISEYPSTILFNDEFTNNNIVINEDEIACDTTENIIASDENIVIDNQINCDATEDIINCDEYSEEEIDNILSTDLESNEDTQFYNDINEQKNVEYADQNKMYNALIQEDAVELLINLNTDENAYNKLQCENDIERSIIEPINPTKKDVALIIDDNIDYVGAFADMYTEKPVENIQNNSSRYDQNNSSQNTYSDNFNAYDRNVNEMTMTDLKSVLATKSIKLKPHYRNNTINFYTGKFYYSNKVLRDWSIAMYAIYVTFLLIAYASASTAGMSLGWTLGFLFMGALFPITCTGIWLHSPLRRKRNSFTPSNAFLIAFITLIALTVVIIIFGFFAFQINIEDPKEYVPGLIIPILSLFLLPISVAIYALFYGHKRYHIG